MPYIVKEHREILDPFVEPLIEELLEWSEPKFTDSAITYCLTQIIDALYGRDGYKDFARAMGVLECVKQEFYRRKIAPYENEKCQENGEVYQ